VWVFGVHQYLENCNGTCNGNIIRCNYIHDNGSIGILIGSGDNNVAYDNIVTNNGKRSGQGGIQIGFRTPNNNQVYNKIYLNYGNYVLIRRGSINSKVNNNICWRNGSDTVEDQSSASTITGNRVTDPLIGASGSSTLQSQK
jgi:hypothetical protein